MVDSDKKLRILQVLPALHVGGVERGTLDIARALITEGHEAFVISSGGRLLTQLEAMGAHHKTLPVHRKNPVSLWCNSRAIAKFIREHHIDLVHVRSRAPAWSVKWASQQTGCPFIATFHGFYSICGPLKRYYNSIMTQGQKVIAVSDAIARHIEESYAIPQESIITIPRGTDMNHFTPLTGPSVAHFRATLGIDSDATIVALPGRISEWKGHDVLLSALAQLPDTIHAVFTGQLEKHSCYHRSLSQMIARHGLEARVHCIPVQADIRLLYAMADIVVSASTRPEAFGRVAVEAQAMQKILIATEGGGADETVRDGVTGYRIPANDSAALAKKIQEVQALPASERHAMQEAARAHVMAHFTLKRMCDSTLSLYSRLCGV